MKSNLVRMARIDARSRSSPYERQRTDTAARTAYPAARKSYKRTHDFDALDSVRAPHFEETP
jgi:hypothetical protein